MVFHPPKYRTNTNEPTGFSEPSYFEWTEEDIPLLIEEIVPTLWDAKEFPKEWSEEDIRDHLAPLSKEAFFIILERFFKKGVLNEENIASNFIIRNPINE